MSIFNQSNQIVGVQLNQHTTLSPIRFINKLRDYFENSVVKLETGNYDPIKENDVLIKDDELRLIIIHDGLFFSFRLDVKNDFTEKIIEFVKKSVEEQINE